MPAPAHASDMLIAKLGRRARLEDDDHLVLRALPLTSRNYEPHAYLIREGVRPERCGYILSGLAYRQKLTAEGGRQIISLLVPGDFVDLQHLFLHRADHNVQALTALEVAEIPIVELRMIARAHSALAEAVWVDALIEASVMREAVLNVGRRGSVARVAHLLCELEARLALTGRAAAGFDLPMTQEQLGDAVGLTSVHVNRTLRLLEREGLITRDKRALRILDWTGLQQRADFNPRYLHLDQVSPD